MSVHQIPDGRWICQWRDKSTGRLKKKSFGRGDGAEIKARGFNDSLKLRSYDNQPNDPSPLFSDLAKLYLAHLKASGVPDQSLDNTWWKLKGVVLPALGHLTAGGISKETLNRYVERRRRDVIMVRRGAGENQRLHVLKDAAGNPRHPKYTTIHRELSDIQAILNWAVREDYIRANPVAGYTKPKRDDAVIRPPSPGELKKIMACAPEHLFRAMLLAFYCGLRPGVSELTYLTWDLVDFEKGGIQIISARKGKIKTRFVPLPGKVMERMQAWRNTDDEDLGEDAGPIVHWHGAPVKKLRRSFEAAKAKAGVTRRLRLYDCRHAFATSALEGGGDLKAVSLMLGHSRPDTTMRVYQHVSLSLLRKATDKLPDLLD